MAYLAQQRFERAKAQFEASMKESPSLETQELLNQASILAALKFIPRSSPAPEVILESKKFLISICNYT
jgi:uncharacterized protein HemY